MPTISNRVVPPVYSGRLADLHSVIHDLSAASSYCRFLKIELASEAADQDLIRALGEAAVIRYGRAFGHGNSFTVEQTRFKVPDSWLVSEQIAAHNWFLDLRDKHVAHSLNDYEDCVVTVIVAEAPAPRSVVGIGKIHSQLANLATEQVGSFLGILETLISRLKREIEDERNATQARVHAVPIDDVYQWQEPATYSPSGKPRLSTSQRRRGKAGAPSGHVAAPKRKRP